MDTTHNAAAAEHRLTWNKEANKPETQHRFFYQDFQRQEDDQGDIASREEGRVTWARPVGYLKFPVHQKFHGAE